MKANELKVGDVIVTGTANGTSINYLEVHVHGLDGSIISHTFRILDSYDANFIGDLWNRNIRDLQEIIDEGNISMFPEHIVVDARKKCNCDLGVIMNLGCKCGGV